VTQQVKVTLMEANRDNNFRHTNIANTNELLFFTQTSRPPRLFRLSGFQEPGRGRFRNRTEKRQKEGDEIDLSVQSTSTVRVWQTRDLFWWTVGGGFTEGALRCPVLSTKKGRDPNESNLRKSWISHSLTLPPRLGVERAGVRVSYHHNIW